MWIAFRFCIFVLWTQLKRTGIATVIRCELLSDFVYSFFEHNNIVSYDVWIEVVNCFQILYIRSLNTMTGRWWRETSRLWIAFRFCIFVLWTQSRLWWPPLKKCCELLSDFVYSFFEHNNVINTLASVNVVNCFQILYIRSLNTILRYWKKISAQLWIAFRFCIFVLWTQWQPSYNHKITSCELLSDFVYSFFEHNTRDDLIEMALVVNCFQILYIRSLNTIGFV